MIEAQAPEPVFTSYDAAVAWLDGDGNYDFDDSHSGMAMNNAIDLTAMDDDDSRTSILFPSDADSHSRSQESSAATTPDTYQLLPPPPSQSYFDQLPSFNPNPTASFDDEFSRYMAFQGIAPESKPYRREKSLAISQELKYHYSGIIPAKLGNGLDPDSPEFRLVVYQNMCREVDLEPRDTIADCTWDLQHQTLVDIPDFIDARRTGKKPVPWDDFNEFSEYCRRPVNCMDLEVAKQDAFLSVLLQKPTRREIPQVAPRAPANESRKPALDTFKLNMAVTNKQGPDGKTEAIRVVFGP